MGRRPGFGSMFGWATAHLEVYSRIFEICNEQEESVYNALKNNETNLTFRRSLERRNRKNGYC